MRRGRDLPPAPPPASAPPSSCVLEIVDDDSDESQFQHNHHHYKYQPPLHSQPQQAEQSQLEFVATVPHGDDTFTPAGLVQNNNNQHQLQQPEPPLTANLRAMNPALLERAVALWTNCEHTAATAAIAHALPPPQQSQHDQQSQLLQNEANMLLSAVRRIAAAVAAKNVAPATVQPAFAALTRFASRDLRIVLAVAPTMRPLPQPFDEASFLIGVVVLCAMQAKQTKETSAAAFAEQAIAAPAATVVQAVKRELTAADSRSTTTTTTTALASVLLLERCLAGCLAALEKHVDNYFESKQQQHDEATTTAIQHKLSEFLNPDRIAACALLHLFDLLIKECVVPQLMLLSSNSKTTAAVAPDRIKAWVLRHAPFVPNPPRNSSANASAAAAAAGGGMRRFRYIAAKSDPQMARRLSQSWSAAVSAC